MNIFNNELVSSIAQFIPLKDLFNLQKVSKNCNQHIVNFINSTLIGTQQLNTLDFSKMSFDQLTEFYMKYNNINVIDFSNFYSENIKSEKMRIAFLICDKIKYLRLDNLKFDSEGNFKCVKDNKVETINFCEMLKNKSEIKEISIKNCNIKLPQSLEIMKNINSLETISTKSYTLKKGKNINNIIEQISLTNDGFLTSSQLKIIIDNNIENIFDCKIAIKDRNDLALITAMLKNSERKNLISSITFLEGLTWNFPAQPLGELLSLMHSVGSIDFSKFSGQLFEQKIFLELMTGEPKKLIFTQHLPPNVLSFEFFENVEFLDFDFIVTDDAIIKNAGNLQNLKTLSFINNDKVFENLLDSLLDQDNDKPIFTKLKHIIVKSLNYKNTDFEKVRKLQKSGISVRLHKEINTKNKRGYYSLGQYTGNYEETKDIIIKKISHAKNFYKNRG